MFSSMAFLFFIRLLLNSLFGFPPNAFLISISACLPIASLISATRGVTVLFIDTSSSILLFNVRNSRTSLSLTELTTSALNTLLSNIVLYFGFSATSCLVSSAIKPFACSTSDLMPPCCMPSIPSSFANEFALRFRRLLINLSRSCLFGSHSLSINVAAAVINAFL